ncbi:PREDICTED: DENN domain-containing protein 1B [Dipodomys ordii]|uniref:DENN domain-containing protein 1B n=1 Tax=Dipodomys ordii TaxID=10020 RepID=A0A1S3F7W7_DIPOR|nr:PREDICTED: DENN domain-containing protein 1B [Dipodomys ordii]
MDNTIKTMPTPPTSYMRRQGKRDSHSKQQTVTRGYYYLGNTASGQGHRWHYCLGINPSLDVLCLQQISVGSTDIRAISILSIHEHKCVCLSACLPVVCLSVCLSATPGPACTWENPERTFDLVLKVKCPASENEDPVVLWKFPEDFGDQEVLQSVPKFCFPFDVERVSQNQVGQHFTFVLTDIESKQRFGFCRLTSGGKICLCILSYLPWFEVYYKLLNTLADYLVKELENDLNETLKSLYNHPVPKANTPVNLSVVSTYLISDDTLSPETPAQRNLTEYFVAVDVYNMVHLYACMLHERRVVITSSKLSTLTACVHGSAALLYPMYWQHIYIPVLPSHLLDYCCAPMPYLIGVHSSLLERVRNKSLEDVVLLNVDTNTFESPFNDLSNLPSDVVSALKNKLKKQSTATGDGVARAFLRAQAALFGSYRDALRYKPGEPVTFCEESFVKHRSSVMKQFLETAVNLQLFKQFIDGRLAKLNAGKGFSDVFEEEITSGGFCGGNPRSYQQWVHTVKKGSAFFNTAVTRATPAVRTAYKFAKNHAKLGLKEVKSKLKHKENEEEYGSCSGLVQYTPVYTSHNEKEGAPEKRKLAQVRARRPDGAVLDEDIMERASKLSSDDGEEAPAYFYESDESGEAGERRPRAAGEMDLLGEILDSLSTHSADQGKLAAARSLDFFRSMDDIDYKPANKSNAPSENNLASLCGGGAAGDPVPVRPRVRAAMAQDSVLPPRRVRTVCTCRPRMRNRPAHRRPG